MNQPDAGGRVRQFLSKYRRPPVAPQPQTLLALTEKANIDAFNQLVKMNEERMQSVGCMQLNLEKGCELIKKMSIIAYVLGSVLIVMPFIVFLLSTPRDPNLLWFSGIGMAETVAILMYQPMNRVQKATSDMVQSTIILSSWATEVGLTLYLLKLEEIKENGKIAETTDLIGKITGEHVRWFQHYTENDAEDESESKKKPAPKAAADNQTLQPNPKTPA
jgi:hypothetical protein